MLPRTAEHLFAWAAVGVRSSASLVLVDPDSVLAVNKEPGSEYPAGKP